MMFLDSVVRFVIAVLLNGLWEAGLLALAAFLALRAMPNANATTRHAVLAAAFYASLILPVVTAFVTVRVPATNVTAIGAVTYHSHKLHREAARGTTVPLRVEPTTRPRFTLPALRPSLALHRAVVLAIVAVWLLGTLVVLARLWVGLRHLEQLKRDALPLPVDYRARLQRWTQSGKGPRDVRLCHSAEIAVPMAVGLFDAMIIVPDHLLDDLDPADIDRIILHELAHLRRNDDWINVVERLAQAVLFFNPGVLWLTGQLDLEREVACDDWVLQQYEALPYATCLTKIAETTLWPYHPMSAPGTFVTRRAMSVRIERLLSKRRDVRISASWAPTGIAVVAVSALSIVALAVSPSVAYTIPVVYSSPAPRVPSPRVIVRYRPVVVYRDKSVQPVTPVAAPTHAQPRPVATLKPKAAATVAAVSPTAASLTTKAPAAVASSSNYIDELAALGYTGLSVDQLVQLRAVGVTADYIRELQSVGLQHPSVNELVRLRALGVQADYVKAMRDRFGASTPVDDIASARAVGVTPQYVDEMASFGLRNLSFDQVRSLRALGVSSDYLRDLARAGYSGLTIDQVRTMRALDIDAAFVQLAAAHGFKNLPIEKLIRLKESGILQ
jgi:beta-lactamase regulating signal transducer with metallopeptidase domain